MDYIKITSIYDFISLFPLVIFAYALLDIVNNSNFYILTGLLLSEIIHKTIKYLTKNMNPNIFKRPDNARDTNIFNKGGFAGNKPGFPSGHTLCVSYVMNYLILVNNDSFFDFNSVIKQILIGIIAYARVKKGAHRIIQVIAGYITGLALAYGIYNLQ